MRFLLAEWQKSKHHPIRWLLFLMPVLYGAFLIFYLTGNQNIARESVAVFQLFIETWCVLVFPLFIGTVSASMVQEEEKAGHFVGFLSHPSSRSHLIIGKVFTLFIVSFLSLCLAFVTYFVMAQVFLKLSLAWPIYLLSMVLIILSSIPLIILHIWLSFAYGVGASIGLSIFGVLNAALIGATSLGEKVWFIDLWAIPVRLSKAVYPYLQFTRDMLQPPVEITSGMIHYTVFTGLLATIILSIGLGLGSIFWFNRWEGKPAND